MGGKNPLKLLYSIMILNTISLPYKAGPIKSIKNDILYDLGCHIEDQIWEMDLFLNI